MRVAQREIGAHGSADGTARVGEAVDADAVQRVEQTVGEIADGGGRVGRGSAVPGQVVPEDPPVLGEPWYLAIPHVPCGAQGGTDHQDRSVFWPVKAVLQGVR